MSSTENEEIHPIVIALMVVAIVVYFWGGLFPCENNKGIQKRQRPDVEARHCKLYHDTLSFFPMHFYPHHYLRY